MTITADQWRSAKPDIDAAGNLRICDRLVMPAHYREIERRYIDALLADRPVGDLLEIGYGLGYASDRIAESRRARNHVIVELNLEVAKWASRERSDAIVIQCDWREYQAPAGQRFDFVYFDAIGFDGSGPAYRPAIASVWRFMKRGGRVAIFVTGDVIEIEQLANRHFESVYISRFDYPILVCEFPK